MTPLPAAARTPVPWKNGGGVTREVAASPPGAGLADFDWRVSIADVTAAGPFSRFENVDRVLLVLEGRLELHFDKTGETITLAPGQSHAFPGDVPVTGTPLDGPVRDLNVMARRNRHHPSISPGHPGLPQGATRIAIATDTLDAYVLLEAEPFPAGVTDYEIRLDPR